MKIRESPYNGLPEPGTALNQLDVGVREVLFLVGIVCREIIASPIS